MDMLCGVVIDSGNDVFKVFVEYIGGLEVGFVVMMNVEVVKFGMIKMYFENVVGLFDL